MRKLEEQTIADLREVDKQQIANFDPKQEHADFMAHLAKINESETTAERDKKLEPLMKQLYDGSPIHEEQMQRLKKFFYKKYSPSEAAKLSAKNYGGSSKRSFRYSWRVFSAL